MNKFDYVQKAFVNDAYCKKGFLLSIFSIVPESENEKIKDIPFGLMKEGDKAYFLDNNEKIYIDDYVPDLALFNKNEEMTLKVDQNQFGIKEEMKTTLGRFLFNSAVLYQAFGNKVGYRNEKVAGSDIRSIIANMMVDNPDISGIEVPEDKASVDDCLKVTQQLDYLEGLNHIFVKSASLELFTVDPEIIKLRDKLLAELEAQGKLNDEIEVARVINLLIAKDAEIQYNGPSRDVFIKHDFIANSRKKMFLLFDMVPNFHTGKYQLLKNSLQEGWDFNEFDGYANTAISASFDRGVGTARGGTEFKVAILLTNHIKVIAGDCKSPRTERVLLNNLNFKGWVGGYIQNGSLQKIIADSDKESLIGQRVNIRVPQYCQQPDNNLCGTCVGNKLNGLSERISSEVALIFTIFMLSSMKSMHVSKLNTVTTELKNIIR